jgi:hypothetical protein
LLYAEVAEVESNGVHTLDSWVLVVLAAVVMDQFLDGDHHQVLEVTLAVTHKMVMHLEQVAVAKVATTDNLALAFKAQY